MKRIHDLMDAIALKARSVRARRALIACLLVAQLAVMALWAAQRSNYYIDELFSFGYAYSYTFDKKDIGYIDESEAWQYERWIDNATLKRQMVVTQAESLIGLPPLEGLRRLLTRRNYFGLLNLVMYAFSPGRLNAAPGIVLNAVMFILVQLVLFRIVRELTGSFATSALAILMYGFSAIAVSMVLYVRFYTLVTLLLLLALRLHQIMWREERLPRCALMTLLSMALILLALKDSELVIIVGCALVAAYATGTLLSRQYRKAGLYIATVFPIGIYYVVRKTKFVKIALNLREYAAGAKSAEMLMADKLLNVSPARVAKFISRYIDWVRDSVFGSPFALYGLAGIVLLLLAIRLRRERRPTARSGAGRRAGFVWVIAAVCAVYGVFALLAALNSKRYFMFIAPMLVVLFWKMIHELSGDTAFRGEVLAVCLVLTVVGILCQQCLRPGDIDYVYAQDRPVIRAVRDSGIEDAIVIYTDAYDSSHSTYECMNLLPETARLYPVNTTRHHIDTSACPDEVLVWARRGKRYKDYIADLTDAGYALTRLGRTHASTVYIAKKARNALPGSGEIPGSASNAPEKK